MSLKFTVFSFAFILYSIPGLLLAQANDELLVEEIRNAYNQFNFTEAEIKAKSALKNFQNFTPEQLTEIHKILGIIYFSQNKSDEARSQFESALSLTPELQLDQLFVSPKILNFYNQIKAEWKIKQEQGQVNNNSIFRYVLVKDKRPSAALRSMILPGWGQLFKGEQVKGRIVLSLWGVGVVGSLATHLARTNAKNDYLAETKSAEIESKYNKYNTLHKLRNNFFIFSAGIWLYSYIDAILKRNTIKYTASSNEKAILIRPSISSEQSSITVQLNF